MSFVEKNDVIECLDYDGSVLITFWIVEDDEELKALAIDNIAKGTIQEGDVSSKTKEEFLEAASVDVADIRKNDKEIGIYKVEN